jgi:uncharacterized protein (DUF305 family)
MMTPSTRSLAGALVAALAVAGTAACGAARGPAMVATAEPAMGDAAAIARAKADSARLPWTAADARFMSAMIHHHAQAVEMSRMAATHGAGPQVLTLANRIINAQQDEIAIMERWLRDRLQPVPTVTPTLTATADPHAGHGAHAGHDGAMPGMLTTAQMQELDKARGAEFDRLFLTYMIQHHQGATQMVKELFATDGAGQDETVFRFATDVNVDQTTEIARMQRMLVLMQFQK